jgi:hypothetical protein
MPSSSTQMLRGGGEIGIGALQSGKRNFHSTIGRPVSQGAAFLLPDDGGALCVEPQTIRSTGQPRIRNGRLIKTRGTGISTRSNGFLRAARALRTLGAGAATGSVEIAKIRLYMRVEGKIAAPPTPEDVANAVMDGAEIEPGLSFREALRLMSAVLAGKVSGAEGSTLTFRAAGSDHKVRLVVDADTDGNRITIVSDTGA